MSSCRRVVTTLNEAGKSVIASDGPAPTSWCMEVWATGADRPLGFDPSDTKPTLMPPSGGTRWRIVDIPPDSTSRRQPAGMIEGVDDKGWHTTNTVDYVMILEGEVTLELDDAKVDLHPGDCVVQRATNHRWRNHGQRAARMIAVMISLE